MNATIFKQISVTKRQYNVLFALIALLLFINISGCAIRNKQDNGFGYTGVIQRVWMDNFQNANFIDSQKNISHAAGSITLEKEQSTEPVAYESRPNSIVSIGRVNSATNYGATLPAEKGTIELWIKGDFLKAGYQPIVSDWGKNQIFLRGIGDGKLQVAFHDVANSKYIFAYNLSLPSGQWNFVVVTWDMISANAKVYCNGILFKSGAITNAAWRQSQSPVKLGSNAFNGQISNLRIMYSVLSESDIQKDFSIAYKAEGEIRSNSIEPLSLSKWGNLNCDVRTNSATSIKTNIEYYNGTDWSIIPDSDLSGNSNGFTSFPVNLSALGVNKYKKIRLKAILKTNDKKTTPELLSWNVNSTGVVRERPYLFVNEQLIEKIKLKPTDLSNLNAYVKSKYERLTSDPANTIKIKQEVAALTDPNINQHPIKYMDASMYLGMDAFFNKSLLSAEYGKQYLLSIIEKPVSVELDSITYGRLFALGSLYDWLSNYLDQQTKTNVRKYILDQIEYMESKWMFFSLPLYSGGHSMSANGSGLLSLLSISEDISNDNIVQQDKFNYYYYKIVSNWRDGYNPMQEWIAESGGYHMGWAYGASYTDPYPHLAWEYGAAKESWIKNWRNEMTYWFLYGLRNSNNSAERGKGGYDNFDCSGDVWVSSWDAQGQQLLLSAEFYNNLYAKWIYNKFDKTCSSYWDILYKHFDKSSGTSPSALPLSRQFKNSGFVIMRDSWDLDDNTLVVFKSTPFYSVNHHHKDQNSFTVYYKGPLAIDSGGYNCMGGYGSKHWWNYYTRSVAHNTILVYDPNENFGLSQYGKNSNDGGQKFFRYGSPTFEQMKNGGENHLDGIKRYEEGAYFTYSMGDATKAYSSSKLEKFERHIINLRNYSYSHPVIVVYDKVISKNADSIKKYLLHSINEPVIDNNTVTIEINDGVNFNNKSTLHQRTLLPKIAQISKIGGRNNNKQFYVADDGNGAPHNYDEGIIPSDTRALREAGEWRIEISPADKSLDDRFLNILSITDSSADHVEAEAKSQYISSPGMDGAIINDADGKEKILVLFKKNEDEIDESIDLKNKMSFDKLLIAGLSPGSRYEIKIIINNIHIKSDLSGRFLSSDQGLIELSNGAL